LLACALGLGWVWLACLSGSNFGQRMLGTAEKHVDFKMT
jgi:hypothetical protein